MKRSVIQSGAARLLTVALALLATALPARAQAPKVAQSGMTFLQIPIGARGAAMGYSNAAVVNDASAFYWNPSAYAFIEGTSLFANRTQWIGDIDVNAAALSHNAGRWGIVGANVTAVEWGVFHGTRRADNDAGYEETGTFSPTSMAVGVSYAYLISNGFHSVMGNHDHFMWFEKHKNDPKVNKNLYPWDCWSWNGGGETIRSFGLLKYSEITTIDKKYWDFIDSMPLRIDIGNFVLTHAPIGYYKDHFFDFEAINQDKQTLDSSCLWNRYAPYSPKGENNSEYDGKIQLYGHQSSKGVLWHTDKHLNGIYRDEFDPADPPWAICLDTWRRGYLSGLDLSTMKVYKQEIVD